MLAYGVKKVILGATSPRMKPDTMNNLIQLIKSLTIKKVFETILHKKTH